MRTFRSLIILALVMTVTYSWAQIPRTLSYQGVLTDSLGTPMPDGETVFTFALFDDSLAGTELWSEQHTLLLKWGLVSVVLGSNIPFPDSVKFDRPYWLTIACDRCGFMEPRIPLTSVGYSFNSLRADTALYSLAAPSQKFVDSARITGMIVDNSVSTDKILNGTIRREDVEPGFIAPYADTALVSIVGDTLWKMSGDNVYRETGFVGIGTATPTSPLTMPTRIGTEIQFPSTGSNADIATNANLYLHGNSISFLTDDQYRMIINSSGRVGIGNSSPQSRLDVTGSVRASDTVYASAYMYAVPETGYVNGSAWALGRVLYPPDSLGYMNGLYNASDGIVFYEVPLQLPDGVSLISVDLYGYDDNATDELSLTLLYQELTWPGGMDFGGANSGVSYAGGDFVATAKVEPPILMDNSFFAVFLQIMFPPVLPTTGLRYYSFRAAYTYDRPGAISPVTVGKARISQSVGTPSQKGDPRGARKR